MSEESVKRWTAKRKASLVKESIQGKINISEAARQHDLTPSDIEGWVDDAMRGMENALRSKPRDIREEYEARLKELNAAYGEAMLENKVLKKCHALMQEDENLS